MNKLWMDCSKDWDTFNIPKYCNPQAYVATQLLLDICKPKGEVDDTMLNKLIQNLKLLTLVYQHIKATECKRLFMAWWNKDYQHWPEEFNYKKHNRHFVRWIENNQLTASKVDSKVLIMASMSMPTGKDSWCQSLPRSTSQVAGLIPLVTKKSLHCWFRIVASHQALHQHSKLWET